MKFAFSLATSLAHDLKLPDPTYYIMLNVIALFDRSVRQHDGADGPESIENSDLLTTQFK